MELHELDLDLSPNTCFLDTVPTAGVVALPRELAFEALRKEEGSALAAAFSRFNTRSAHKALEKLTARHLTLVCMHQVEGDIAWTNQTKTRCSQSPVPARELRQLFKGLRRAAPLEGRTRTVDSIMQCRERELFFSTQLHNEERAKRSMAAARLEIPPAFNGKYHESQARRGATLVVGEGNSALEALLVGRASLPEEVASLLGVVCITGSFLFFSLACISFLVSQTFGSCTHQAHRKTRAERSYSF